MSDQYISVTFPLHPSGRELTTQEIEEMFPALQEALANKIEEMTGVRPDPREQELWIVPMDAH